MRDAMECLERAKKCVRMAWDCRHPEGRRALVETADHWRVLATAADEASRRAVGFVVRPAGSVLLAAPPQKKRRQRGDAAHRRARKADRSP